MAPDTVERERFGSILGTVMAVSALPVTKQSVARLVGHAEMVETLLPQGPAIEVAVTLTQDASTVSRYKWSSSAGPALPITAGTTMTGRVVIEHRAPFTYVLPILRDISGLY